MYRKWLLLGLVLAGVLLCPVVGRGASDEAVQVEQAEHAHQAVIADEPGSERALEAQEKLAVLYVECDRQGEAETALQSLLSGYSTVDGVAGAVTRVADAWQKTGKNERACEVYRQVIERWPADEHAMWSQMGLAVSYSQLRDVEAADSAFETLCSEYRGQVDLSKAVCLVGDSYRRLRMHKKARETYEYELEHWPEAEPALWSRMGLAISNIRLRAYDAAADAFARLNTDFPEDERMPIAACLVADEYRSARQYADARGMNIASTAGTRRPVICTTTSWRTTGGRIRRYGLKGARFCRKSAQGTTRILMRR